MAGTGTGNLLIGRRQVCTEAILDAKIVQKTTWETIAKHIGRSPVWVTSCCLGENSMDESSAKKLIEFLKIKDADEGIKKQLMLPPLKAQNSLPIFLQDPCISRLHEINLVYGLAIKELIQEKFGDGIMSAIDFNMEVKKEGDPAGDRVKLIMSGKFLPYKSW